MTEPLHSYEGPWRARISTEDGTVVGAGVLVDRRTVLTADRVGGAREHVRVDIAGHSGLATMVERFHDLDEDLAVLSLLDEAPRTSRPAALVSARPRPGDRLSAYGYPAGTGRWLDLVVPTPVDPGAPWVELATVGGRPNDAISAEFSGAGVVDADMRVVGLLVARRNGTVPWLVPTERLATLWPALRAILDAGRPAKAMPADPVPSTAVPAGPRSASSLYVEPAGAGAAGSAPDRSAAAQAGPAETAALRRLLELVADADAAGPGGEVVVLTGARGTGKSMLLAEVARRLDGVLLSAAGSSVQDVRRRLAAGAGADPAIGDDELWSTLRAHPVPILIDALGRAVDPAGVANLLTPLVGERAGGPATLVIAGRSDMVAPLVVAGAPVLDLDQFPPLPGSARAGGFRVPAGFAPRATVSRDFPTTDDRLSYRFHAQAIASFLRHRDTRPPLTIGIKGAWGAGKTSLMRMVQDELDPGAAAGDGRHIRFDPDSGRQVRRWRRNDTGRVTNDEVLRGSRDAAEPTRVRARPSGRGGDWRPTVWFNPWVYQSGDQVWAGLAHEIIEQVTRRLSAGDRERFWLRLNLARADREQIRRWWYRLLLGRLLPLALCWLGLSLVAAVGFLAGRLAGTDLVADAVGLCWGGGTLGFLLGAVGRRLAAGRAAVTGPLSKLVSAPPVLPQPVLDAALPDPGYSARLGFLHLVHADIRRVLDLVATPDRPLVVFVDDLDRCSPGTVAQVIEAVNLFLAGEFPNCVFVIAMEPAAVAAHVEVAYRDLAVALDDDGGAALGWRFLEKIVQLPLSLPAPDPERDVKPYLDEILDGAGAAGRNTIRRALTPEPGDAPPPDVAPPRLTPTRMPATAGDTANATRSVDELADRIRQRRPDIDTLREVAAGVQVELLGTDLPLTERVLAAAERVFTELYSDAGARGAIHAALPALGSNNPRELKRYVNLFRFYTFVAEQRRLRGAAAPEPGQVAKLAAFAIRWPQLLARLDRQRADPHPLALLESAAGNDEEWDRRVGELLPGRDGARWAGELRAFLAMAPTIGPLACTLL